MKDPLRNFLDKIKHIEFTLGRPKERDKNQPRIIDIDILFMVMLCWRLKL